MKTVRHYEQLMKSLERKRSELHRQFDDLDSQMRQTEKKIQESCPHEKFKVVSQSWHEIKFGDLYWDEKVCTRCKKVLATRSQDTVMGGWK